MVEVLLLILLSHILWCIDWCDSGILSFRLKIDSHSFWLPLTKLEQHCLPGCQLDLPSPCPACFTYSLDGASKSLPSPMWCDSRWTSVIIVNPSPHWVGIGMGKSYSLFQSHGTVTGRYRCGVSFCNCLYLLNGYLNQGASHVPISLWNHCFFFTKFSSWVHPYTTVGHHRGDGPWHSDFFRRVFHVRN